MRWRDWWPLIAGVVLVLLSSYIKFAGGLWTGAQNDHGPVVIAIALFLVWSKRSESAAAIPPANTLAAPFLLVIGALIYLVGVRTRIASFESASHVVLLTGALWMVGGSGLVRTLWFPLFFLVLSIPLPTFVLAKATEGLKAFVSAAAVDVLYRAGYPIARDGAMITLGYYRLLVAEACSGMNSIISLSSVGLLYLYLATPPRLWQLAICLGCILPIAMAANVLRIVILCLITYDLGDEAGRGFLHEFAGMTMFLFALMILFALTAVVSRLGVGASKDARA